LANWRCRNEPVTGGLGVLKQDEFNGLLRITE
jgi:hypothetical protein